MYSVHLYLCDRAYGGPEEGGWYFDCGMPVLHPENRVIEDQEDAFALAHSLNERVLADLNDGLPSIDSVLSRGQYRFIVGEKDELAMPFPAERPFYS